MDFKLSYLIRGLPGHPLHPPLTDVTIGAYTFATVAALADVLGISDHAATQGWWLALLFGLIATTATAATGLADWLTITWGSELWKTATLHALANLSAGVVFLITLLQGHDDFKSGNVHTGSMILTLIGFALLTLGGWLGGAVTFVHGMRVLNLVEEPTTRAASPLPHPEKEMAEGS